MNDIEWKRNAKVLLVSNLLARASMIRSKKADGCSKPMTIGYLVLYGTQIHQPLTFAITIMKVQHKVSAPSLISPTTWCIIMREIMERCWLTPPHHKQWETVKVGHDE